MEALLVTARSDARYIRFSVRWTEPPWPRPRHRDADALTATTAITAIEAIEIAVVSERPLAPATMPLLLEPGWDRWF